MPVQAPRLTVDAASRVKRPVPPKAILWPTVTWFGNLGAGADSSKFPGLTAIKARHAAQPAAPLETFLRAVRDAQDRVLVMDDFLFRLDNEGRWQGRVAQVLGWLPETLAAPDVRFLTGAPATQFQKREIERRFAEREQVINARLRRQVRVTIEVRFTLRQEFPYVHDRFAIIDDDLWHFGATVGGLHNQVNAVSHGWDTDDHDAINFYDMAWSGDSDASFDQGSRNRRR
jgi:hypothetical protein